MYALAAKLFPIHRSITGDGVRRTLGEIRQLVPELRIHEVPSGTRVLDWEIPHEWRVRCAYVEDEQGRRIVDFKKNSLHVVAYSVPVDVTVSLEELDAHLYSLPDRPDAVPYVTAYYKDGWGFCVAHEERRRLKAGRYHVVIDSTLEPGSLTYGELVLPGQEAQEVFLSTYVCHPSLANDNVSGPVVTTFLAKWLRERTDRRYTYRVVYVPETIGSITYLSRHLEHMKRHTLAGFVVTCVGDDRCYSYMPSRGGDTVADRVCLHLLRHYAPDFVRYSFLQRGSDERQYCSPGVDLPVVSIMRSKYEEYPEYHTSHDDLSIISPAGLGGAYEMLRKAIVALERNHRYRMTVPGEPQLGKRGLYPSVHQPGSVDQVRSMRNLIAYCDGRRDLVGVADAIKVPIDQCYSLVDQLLAHNLLDRVE